MGVDALALVSVKIALNAHLVGEIKLLHFINQSTTNSF